MISPHTGRPVRRRWSTIMPNRPKSISATVPGRGVLHPHRGLAAPSQFRFRTKRRNDGYDTGHPRASSNSRMRVSCKPVTGEPLVNLVRPRLQQVLPGRHRLPRPRLPNRRQPASTAPRWQPAHPERIRCRHILGEVSLDKPVPANAILLTRRRFPFWNGIGAGDAG